MYSFRSILFFFIISILLLGGSASFAASERVANRTIVIASDIWCPVSCSIGQENEGLAVELMREIFEAKGFNVVYKVMPWSRAIYEVETGGIDAILATNKNEAPDLSFSKRPIIRTSTDVYVLRNNPLSIVDINKIHEIRLGAIQGYDYAPEFNEYIAKNKNKTELLQLVAGEDALQQNIRKLVAGRIDAFIDSKLIVGHVLRDMKLDESIRRVEPSFPMADLYIAFSPKNNHGLALNTIYNEALEDPKLLVKIKAIYAKYKIDMP